VPKKSNSLAELWKAHTPPPDPEEAGIAINVAICDAVARLEEQDAEGIGIARRGCGDVWSRVKDRALLVEVVHQGTWERVRKLGPETPKLDQERCLWLLAAAWRVMAWLDRETLTQKQLHKVRSIVTNLKSGVSSLPSGFAIEAELQLREDEYERAKPPGPKMVPSKAKTTVNVK